MYMSDFIIQTQLKNNMTKYETTQKIKKLLLEKTKDEVSKLVGISRPTLDARNIQQ